LTRAETKSPFNVLFRKGASEVLIYLLTVERARYSDIRKQKFVVGDRSLSRLLKSLQDKGLIKREALPTYPVSTNYSLTDEGKEVAELLKSLKALLSKKE
jgi:DNA-binding HxlR family transcriptional regulator